MHRAGTAFRRVISASILLCAIAGYETRLVLAADRFVATTGSDATNDCLTQASPCASVAHTLGVAASGDTVKLAAGKYRENNLAIASSTVLSISGGWDPGFTSRDPAANRTILDGMKTGTILKITAGTGQVVNVTLDGLTFFHAGQASVGVAGVHSTDDGQLTLSFTDCVLTKNVGANAGGVYAISEGTSSIDLSINNSTLTKNGRYVVGGIRVLADQSSSIHLSVTDSSLTENLGFDGAAITAEATGTATATVDVVRSTLSRNRPRKSGGSGGAVYLGGNSPLTANFVNTAVVKNQGSQGGGVYIQGPAVHASFVNCTIMGNRFRLRGALGGGVFVTAGGTVDLLNTIVRGNRATTGADLYLGVGTANADHCDLHDVVSDGGTFNDLGGNVDVDPDLADHVHLRPGSPMIDAGTCSGAPSDDIDGDTRPSGAGCDIGADEFAP